MNRVRWIFWVLTAMQWLPVGFLLPVLVLTMEVRGLSLGQIGLVFMSYGLTTAALELPTGGLADQVGRKPVLIVSSALSIGMALAWFGGDAFTWFLGGAVVGGIGRALSTGPLEAWFVDAVHSIEPDAPIRQSLARAGAAEAIGLVTGALIVSGLSYVPSLPVDGAILSTLRLPPLLAASFAVVHLTLVSVLVRETPPKERSLKSLADGVPSTVGRTVKAGFQAGPLRLLFAATVLVGVALSSVELLYQPLFSDLIGSTAESARLFGYLAVGLGATALVGSVLASVVPESIGIHPAAIASISILGSAIAVALFGTVGSVAAGVIIFLIIYVLNGFGYPFLQQILHSETAASQRSTMLSAWSLTGQAGLIVAGTLIAQIGARISLMAALVAAGIAMAGAALIVFSIARKHPVSTTTDVRHDPENLALNPR